MDLRNLADCEPLRLLCCCAPAYRREGTILTGDAPPSAPTGAT